jgi:chromosome segregation ATPase
MTKPTGHPRGRPRKHPRPEDTTTSAAAAVAENEEAVIEERISELEAELAALEGPPAPLTAVDIAQGAVALVDQHEQRRSTIERLLTAFKIKRLEMHRSRYEREMAPFITAREAAGERLQELEAQRIELQEEIGKVRADWGDANTRAESKAHHIRHIEREIRDLQRDGGRAS